MNTLRTCIKFIIITLFILATGSASAYAQNLQLVKDLNTLGGSSSSYPFDFIPLNNQLFFLAAGDPGTYSLYVTTGTGAATQKLSPVTGPLNNIPDIIAYNGKIFFEYDDGVNGNELWSSDGTVAGTTLFKDVYAGSAGSYPQAFTICNGKLFFMAADADGERRLYASDGTEAGTVKVQNNYIDLFNGYTDFAVLDNNIYFRSDNGTGSGYGLWKSDGTLSGTTLVKPNIIPGTAGSNPAVLNGKFYFSCYEAATGDELWVTDGTTAGTQIVKDLSTGEGAPFNLQRYNNKIFFTGMDDTHGVELFSTDGTAAGTQIVKDIEPGTNGSYPGKSIAYNGFLYFFGGGSNAGLWRTDGTDAGTLLIKAGVTNGNFSAIWNGKLYFVLGSGDDWAIWQTDGTTAGTTPIQLQNTSNPVSGLNHDFKFVEFNSELYLSASCTGITVGNEPSKITFNVLPLQLLSFGGTINGTEDRIRWTTSEEINTDHFFLQQSQDGNSFSSVTVIAATGTGTGTRDYHYEQLSARNPGGYYRLAMTDKNGTTTYSSVIKLQRKTGNTAVTYSTLNKQVSITNNTGSVCSWKIFAMNGSLVKEGRSATPVITINLSDLPTGGYIVSTKTINEAATSTAIIHYQ